MKRLSIVDAIISVLMIALVAAVLTPAVARMQRTPADARCQSNLHAWGAAMALYCSDNNGRYPINRTAVGVMNFNIILSPDNDGTYGYTKRFVYGFNWVEALYPYVCDMAKQTGRDWRSFRACPNASTAVWPPTSKTARMTYAFNANLESMGCQLTPEPTKLMMLRELDRTMDSVLRPLNSSVAASPIAPTSPFLDTKDEGISMPSAAVTNPNRHSAGSYILFADGHVRHFTADFFPDQSAINTANCLDTNTQAWYNFGPGSGKQAPYLESIRITP